MMLCILNIRFRPCNYRDFQCYSYCKWEKWNFEGTYVVSSYIEKEMWKP